MAIKHLFSPRFFINKALFLLLLLGLLVGACLFTGSLSLEAQEVWEALIGKRTDTVAFIVWESRFPALLTAIVAGAALGVAGLVMQTVFSNPLAEPGILGVNTGAALGAAVAMLFLRGSLFWEGMLVSGFLLTAFAALLGAVCVLLLLLLCAAFTRNHLTLLIVGVMISYLTASLISLLHFYATAEGISSFVFWGMGDFGGLTQERLSVLAVAVVGGITALLFYSKQLNALLLGVDYAMSVGVMVRKSRTIILLIAGGLSAVVTAACGPIAFIGLTVPHIARLLFATSNHRVLLPLSALIGANLALLCHWAAQGLSLSNSLPINVMTPFIGAPFVFYLLFKKKG